MQWWEYVLQADRERDLTDPAAAAEWFTPVPRRLRLFVRLKWEDDPKPFEGAVSEKWQEGLRALRSLAGRLKGVQTRKPGVHPSDADWVFRGYVGRVRIEIEDDQDEKEMEEHLLKHDKLPPLTAATFRGVSIGWGTYLPLKREKELGKYWSQVAEAVDCFWRIVFGSLATDQLPPICADCGVPLCGPRGRKSRAERCKRCTFKAWYARQPKNELRKRWRGDKAEQRTKNRRAGQ